MAINIELNEKLLSKAMKLGGIRTKKEAVDEALAEYVQRREQLEMMRFLDFYSGSSCFFRHSGYSSFSTGAAQLP